jgi:hypothetical protein
MKGWDQNGSWGDWLGWGEACGVDSEGSGLESVAGTCKHGDKPSGSGPTETLVITRFWKNAYLSNKG